MRQAVFILAVLLAQGAFAVSFNCKDLFQDAYFTDAKNLASALTGGATIERAFSVTSPEYPLPKELMHQVYEAYLRQRTDINGDHSKLMYAFDLAIEETVVNAARHGNKKDPSKQVHFKVRLEKERVQVEVSDEGGRFFDPNDPNEPGNQMRARTMEESFDTETLEAKRRNDGGVPHDPERPDGQGGRGILMSYSFADRVVYVPNTDATGNTIGTKVILEWNFPRGLETEHE